MLTSGEQFDLDSLSEPRARDNNREKKKVIKNAYEIYVVCTEIKCKYNHIN